VHRRLDPGFLESVYLRVFLISCLPHSERTPFVLEQCDLIEPAAMAVVGTWVALWLAGMWKRERTWVDDLGIGVGMSWIALDAFAWGALCF
jgi:hypothetical protein